MSTFAAAKTIFDLKDRKVDHLSMQKLLYLSHMISLGENNKRLITRDFEAWDYGPVEPSLYQKLKAYGSSDIADIFFVEPYNETSNEYDSIKFIVDELGDVPSRRLVAITHHSDGAWSKCYKLGIRGITIPDRLILEEYNDRIKQSES